MDINYYHKNLSKAEEEQFNDYVAKKLSAIRKHLTKFAPDAPMLRISIEKFDKHVAYQVEFCLVLPAKSLVATEASHSMNKAVDLSKDRLLTQIKKHMAQLRNEREHNSIRQEEVIAEVTEKLEK